MDNVLQTALAETVNALADFFGTTTEAIMTHAPEFLAKYGWYYTLNDLSADIFIGFLLGIAFLFFVIMFFDSDCSKYYNLIVFGIFTLCVIIPIGIKIITCMVVPEIVGLHAIMGLIKTI